MNIHVEHRYYGDGLWQYRIYLPFEITEQRVKEILKDTGESNSIFGVGVENNPCSAATKVMLLCNRYYEDDWVFSDMFADCEEALVARLNKRLGTTPKIGGAIMSKKAYDKLTATSLSVRDANFGKTYRLGLFNGLHAGYFIPEKIIRHGPATIVFWNDGTKTVVKRRIGTRSDIYAAVAQAITKKIFGTRHFHKIVDKAVKEGEKGDNK